MKGGERIYLRKRDPDYFRLYRVEKSDPRKRIEVTGGDLYNEWLGSDSTDLAFLTGALVLYEAEPFFRKILRKVSAKGARNINTETKRGLYYLCRLIKKLIEADYLRRLIKKLDEADGVNEDEKWNEDKLTSTEISNKWKRKRKELMNIMEEISRPLKQQWGYAEQPPPRDLYPLSSNELNDMEISPNAIVYMMAQLAAGPIDKKRYDLIKQEVRDLFPADAPTIMDALVGAKFVKPFAVISIPEVSGVGTVAIANHRSEWVRMEANKFCRLIETPGRPIDLGKLVGRRQNGDEQPLTCGYKDAGFVLAKVLPDAWKLLVDVADIKTNKPAYRMEFLLDIDFAVLLAAVLQRMRSDKEEFSRWSENAISFSARDPFLNHEC